MAKRRGGPRLTPLGYIVLGILVLVIIVGVYFVVWSYKNERAGADTPVLPGGTAALPAATPTLAPIITDATPTLPPLDPATPTAPPADASPAATPAATPTAPPAGAAVRTPSPKEENGAVDGTLGNSGVVLRAAPNTDGEILGEFDSGAKLKVYAVDGDYYYCQVVDKKLFGYMAVKFIKKTGLLPGEDPTPSPQPAAGSINGTVSASKLAIRKVPSTDNNTPIGECSQGDALWIFFKTGEFYYVEVVSSGLKGYAYTSFVSADGSVPQGTPVP